MVDKEKDLLVSVTAVDTENVEQSAREIIVEFKQMKAKAKSAFTQGQAPFVSAYSRGSGCGHHKKCVTY